MTLVEVLVVVAILVLLAIVVLPLLGRAKTINHRIGCVNRVREFWLAYQIWAGDNNDKFPFEVSVTNGGTKEISDQAWQTYLVMSNALGTPKILICPNDTARWPAATNFNASIQGHISYFVGLDADLKRPKAMLSGDDNLALNERTLHTGKVNVSPNAKLEWVPGRHGDWGNIGLADGSVYQSRNADLATAGTNGLHLVLP